jgi:uncharacterized protein YcsI (UPF0317 family)
MARDQIDHTARVPGGIWVSAAPVPTLQKVKKYRITLRMPQSFMNGDNVHRNLQSSIHIDDIIKSDQPPTQKTWAEAFRLVGGSR